MSRRSKGNAAEKRAMAILEREGYVVHRVVNAPYQPEDIFGCDLIAKKKGERRRWIQVTADSGIGRKKAELEKYPWDDEDCVEIWRWKGGRKRKHKTTGKMLDAQYFQIYKRDDDYELDKENKIRWK